MAIPNRVRRFIADSKTDREIECLAIRGQALTTRLHAARGRVATTLHYNQRAAHEQAEERVTALPRRADKTRRLVCRIG